MLRYISQTRLNSVQILQQIPTCIFHVMDVVFMVVWLFQQAEIELGEDTMPLKIGELKLVLKWIYNNGIVCSTFNWSLSHVYLVCMTIHLAGTRTGSKLWEIREHKGILYLSQGGNVKLGWRRHVSPLGRHSSLSLTECRWNSSLSQTHTVYDTNCGLTHPPVVLKGW